MKDLEIYFVEEAALEIQLIEEARHPPRDPDPVSSFDMTHSIGDLQAKGPPNVLATSPMSTATKPETLTAATVSTPGQLLPALTVVYSPTNRVSQAPPSAEGFFPRCRDRR